MDNMPHQRDKRRRRRQQQQRQCTTTALISSALILIATIQQHAAATIVGTSVAAAGAAMTTTTKHNEPEYANPAKYDEATQTYYRTPRTIDGNEHHGAATVATLPTYANYFGVIDPKTSAAAAVASGSLITNHNLEEFHDATRTIHMVGKEEEDAFKPTTLTAAGQHYATAAAQNRYPFLLASESFKLPTGTKIDYEINAGNYDDISNRNGNSNSNRALNERNAAVMPEGSMYEHLLQHHQQQQQQQQQQSEQLAQRQQREPIQMQNRQPSMFNTFESTQVQQQQQQHDATPYVANEQHDYFNAFPTTNAAELPDFGSHYLRDYQMAQFSNYLQQQQLQAAQHADYGNEMLLKTPAAAAAATTQLNTKANYAANTDEKQQQQLEKQKLFNYANQQQKRQEYSPLKQQQQQIAESSQLQFQVTDSDGRTISLPTTNNGRRTRDGRNDIDSNDIENYNIANDNNDLPAFQPYYYNQQQQQPEQQSLPNKDQQQIDSMHQQLQQQRQQFAHLQLQLQQHDQLLQQQQNLFTPSATYDIQRPHSHHEEENKLPPVTKTVHHSAASQAALAGIPLGKHVQITKHVPTLSHYQQQHVPFKQVVPIEIPKPVITTVPRPYPIHIPMTKTIAVPQVKEVKIPIERIKPFPVERSVPYVVERRVPYRVEKQVATPYYYPYPIKVPVVKTIVHRIPNYYQHHHHYQHQNQQHGIFGAHSSGNSIYAGGHLR